MKNISLFIGLSMCLWIGLLACGGGYYKVKDPTTDNVYYTKDLQRKKSAIILIDARKGVLTQTKRHSYIASLLGIKNIIVAINKMDLVDFSIERFEKIKKAYEKIMQSRSDD